MCTTHKRIEVSALHVREKKLTFPTAPDKTDKIIKFGIQTHGDKI